MANPLIDFFYLNDNCNWSGNTDNMWASATTNLCNLEPYYLKFTPDGVYTTQWLQDDFYGMKINISVDSFLTYLTNTLVNYTMPILDMNYTSDVQGNLNVEITLTTGDNLRVNYGRI